MTNKFYKSLNIDNNFEEQPPLTSLLESLRNTGYKFNTAVADILDNSISKQATKIDIEMQWNIGNPIIYILDNGKGMSEEELSANINIGSKDPNEKRDKNDLGRFGMGMKTASFAMAEEFCIFSKKNKKISYRSWDLQLVRKTKKWLVIKKFPEWYDDLNEIVKIKKNGTLIIWKKCDRLLKSYSNKNVFLSAATSLREYLGAIFANFINRNKNKISINVNEIPIRAWYPIHPKSRPLGVQKLLNGVEVEPYILPHRSKFLNPDEYKEYGGIKGWNLQQGFYVYRNERLIINGGWINLKNIKNDPTVNLARIIIKIKTKYDNEWQVNILKNSLIIPSGTISETLESIAKKTRVEAYDAAYTNRVKKISRSFQRDIQFIWNMENAGGTKTKLKINRDYPLIAEIKEKYGGNKRDINILLARIEKLLPTEEIQKQENEGTLEKKEFTIEEILELARLEIEKKGYLGIGKKTALKQLFKDELYFQFKKEIEKEYG